MRFRKFAPVSAIAAGALAIATFAAAPPAMADVDSATINPSVWAAGSSPAFTVTLQTSGTLDGSLGFWTTYATTGFAVSQVGITTGTLVGDTITCAGSGITYQSTALLAFTPGDYPNTCWISWNGTLTDYVDNWLEISLIGPITGPQTFTITYPAGLWVAPSTPGVYTLEAYGYDGSDVRTDFTITVGDTMKAQPGARYLQQVSLPASGTCDAIADKDLAWGTGLSGGWTKNWGEWLNDGKGGWACSRFIAWSSSANTWVIEKP